MGEQKQRHFRTPLPHAHRSVHRRQLLDSPLQFLGDTFQGEAEDELPSLQGIHEDVGQVSLGHQVDAVSVGEQV